MTKVIKSKYAIIKNFEDDLKGWLIFRLKRRSLVRHLFSFYKILNRVEPIKIYDLLIRRKKKIQSLTGFNQLQKLKFRFYYNFGFGKTKIFNKYQYRLLHKSTIEKFVYAVASLEARIDVLLMRLHFFENLFDSRQFVHNVGVLINGQLVKNPSVILLVNDIISFHEESKVILKKKLLKFLVSKPLIKPIIKETDVYFRELRTVLNLYSYLFKNETKVNRFTQFGFPRYVEPNFNTLEFLFYGSIKPEDLVYSFRTSLSERYTFFGEFI